VNNFLDIYHLGLNKSGEELCGDQVRVLKLLDRTIVVLSDGLGSGVKANILATLTAEIITTMLRESVDLKEVLSTVIRTLPVDRERRIAYATFTILLIEHEDNRFRVINFDNPAPLYLHAGKIERLATEEKKILGKKIAISQGQLGLGDFIGLMSDGVLYAGLGTLAKFGWGWENIAGFLEEVFRKRVYTVHTVVNQVITMSNRLYEWQAGDDSTFVGVYVRQRNALMIFTGPPVDNGRDYVFVNRLLDFKGRKVVCGGTTANIVASFLKANPETDLSSLAEGVPAIGRLPGIDLVTEGILTLAAALDLLEKSEGKLDALTPEHNGAYLLAREMLIADAIDFLVGQSINSFYQNPLLPRNISIRRYLIDRIAEVLTRFHKDVRIEYC